MGGQLAIISSMATRHILVELADVYTKSTGVAVVVESVGGVDAVRRIREGDPFDLAVLAADALAKLGEEGFAQADSIRPFARSPAAVAVRSGAARPTTCDEPSIRGLVGRARAIGISTGPSGAGVRALLALWSRGNGASPRIVQAQPGVPVARLIADGSVDVGFQQLSELLGELGIDIVGVVPETLLQKTTFSVGICRSTAQTAHARALIAFFTSTNSGSAKRRFGMEQCE